MSWNYRVVKQTYEGLDCYGIHEVYYNVGDDDDTIWAVTESAVGVYCDHDQGEDVEDVLFEMRASVCRFAAALEKPVIDMNTVVFVDRIGEDDVIGDPTSMFDFDN